MVFSAYSLHYRGLTDDHNLHMLRSSEQGNLQLRPSAEGPYSALFTVIDFKFRTHRCGFLSPLSTSLNCPSVPSGLPPIVVATITSPLCSEPSTSVTEKSTQYLSVPSATT